jgi:hypothetical protein
MNKKLRRNKTTHTIRTDFGFNLLRSASKLKRGVIDWWVILIFRDSGFFIPNIFVGFYVPWIVMRTLSVYRFQSDLFYSSVFVLCCFFFSTWCCQYYMIYWTHPLLNCWQNRPNQWGCRKGKNYLFNYIGLHIFVKCEQKNLFTMLSIDQ